MERKINITNTDTRNEKQQEKKKNNNQNFLTKSSYADNLTGEFYKTFKE